MSVETDNAGSGTRGGCSWSSWPRGGHGSRRAGAPRWVDRRVHGALRRRSLAVRSVRAARQPPGIATPHRRPPPRRPDGAAAETVAQPVKVDNALFVRDYARCILCYKCVEAAAPTRRTPSPSPSPAEASTRASPRSRHPARHLRMRLLRQLHQRLPDGRPDVPLRVRDARGRTWDESRRRSSTPSAPTAASAAPRRSTAGRPDRQVMSPLDSAVTERQPVREGPLRVRLRPGAPEGVAARVRSAMTQVGSWRISIPPRRSSDPAPAVFPPFHCE